MRRRRARRRGPQRGRKRWPGRNGDAAIAVAGIARCGGDRCAAGNPGRIDDGSDRDCLSGRRTASAGGAGHYIGARQRRRLTDRRRRGRRGQRVARAISGVGPRGRAARRPLACGASGRTRSGAERDGARQVRACRRGLRCERGPRAIHVRDPPVQLGALVGGAGMCAEPPDRGGASPARRTSLRRAASSSSRNASSSPR